MRLLVVTNCRAQAALEVVWQQGQASGRAPGGLEERGVMVSCPSEPGSILQSHGVTLEEKLSPLSVE